MVARLELLELGGQQREAEQTFVWLETESQTAGKLAQAHQLGERRGPVGWLELVAGCFEHLKGCLGTKHFEVQLVSQQIVKGHYKTQQVAS
ncbi:unnamed protein product [Schistosoma mattheei]|uniref:Uncharacterized protein n=1 Tax=Schistosoma mattheei TaxID=31246 RepID=A0A3P8G9A7_9TREM|nr:unnamed protein product [Schistosoma mattheei]